MRPAVLVSQLREDLVRRASLREHAVDAELDRLSGERLQLVVGAHHRRVVAGDHLRHRLQSHVRERALAELEEGQVGAVGEQQQLEVQLVELVVEVDRPVVGRHQPVVRAEPVVVDQLLLVLELGQPGDLERRQLLDACVDLRLPALDERVPVLVVVADPRQEGPEPLLDLGRVAHLVGGDVDVAVDDAVLDAEHGRDREDAPLVEADREVARLGRDHVERRHRLREVHPVVEPEAALFLFPPGRVEEQVVGIHLLPAFSARRRLDVEGARELVAHGVSPRCSSAWSPRGGVERPGGPVDLTISRGDGIRSSRRGSAVDVRCSGAARRGGEGARAHGAVLCTGSGSSARPQRNRVPRRLSTSAASRSPSISRSTSVDGSVAAAERPDPGRRQLGADHATMVRSSVAPDEAPLDEKSEHLAHRLWRDQ